MSDEVVFSLRLPARLAETLRRAARQRGVTIAAMARIAIVTGLLPQPYPAPSWGTPSDAPLTVTLVGLDTPTWTVNTSHNAPDQLPGRR